ncbi:MAG: lysylphosphatidylglycerol synthase transmembrane domain-containing protein [Flavobacteriaceae bacterium]|nr:lysylphosphatidylglycerol synthase transmembrane domain-containing protein [Flavobacteriaceae bacterium]
MSKSFISVLRNLIPLGLGVFLIYYSLSTITADQRTLIWSYIQQAHPFPILISIVFGALSHLSRAYRWKFLLNPLGYRPNFINLTGAVLINYLSNLGIPRSGDVLRVTVISAYEKISFSKGLGTVISERVIDLVMMMLLVFSAMYMGGDWVQEQLSGSMVLLVSFGIFIGLVVAIMVFPFLINTKRFPFLTRVKSFFLNIVQGIVSIRSIPNALAFWAHTVFIWLMYVLMFWVVQFSLPEAALLSPQVALIGFVAGGLSIVVTNGGIGLYPIAVAAVLSHYGMSYEMALAYGWIAWSTQTLMILLFGGLSFVFLPVFNRKK